MYADQGWSEEDEGARRTDQDQRARIWTWGRESGGGGSGLHMSRDGGDTWTPLTGHGLPEPPLGKIGLAMSPDNSDRIYALIETNSNREYGELDDHQGVLWRSDNGGDSWRMVNGDHTLAQRPLYYTRAAVAPDDHNEIHFLSTAHTVSLDGGMSIQRGGAGGDGRAAGASGERGRRGNRG